MDTEYVIMSVIELGEVTPLEAEVLQTDSRVYEAIRAKVDANEAFPPLAIAGLCRETLCDSTPGEQHLYALRSLEHAKRQLEAVLGRTEMLVQREIGRDLYPDRFSASLMGLLQGSESATRKSFVTREADVNESVVRKILDQDGVSLRARLTDDAYRISAALEALSQNFPIGPDARIPRERPAVEVPNHKQTAQEEAKLVGRAKRAIRRAYSLFDAHSKSQMLSMFVGGAAVEISHPESDLKFVVQSLTSNDWLIRRSAKEFSAHTPFELAVLTKDDIFLGNLCVYFKGSPVLDQLLALTLYIEAGEEEKILEKANFFGNSHWTQEFCSNLGVRSQGVLAAMEKCFHVQRPHGEIEGSIEQALQTLTAPMDPVFWQAFENPAKRWIISWLGDPFIEISKAAESARQVRTQLARSRQGSPLIGLLAA